MPLTRSGSMSSVLESPGAAVTTQPPPDAEPVTVGVVTRAVSWGIDAVLINVVAIITGVGISLLVSMFPFLKHLKPLLAPLAGGAYVLWVTAYFVAFWSTTGQTPGARLLQIRLVSATQERLKPRRALLRFIGMNLAALPLFAGYVPILFKRRGFPDWLARTLVLDAPQLSLAELRRVAKRAERIQAVEAGAGGTRENRNPQE
jgi:uncharacterized RDD family membrane protein YckC